MSLRSNFVSSEIRKAIYEADNHKCVYCGCQVEIGKTASLDHIKPRSKYPHKSRDIKNLVTACVSCNSRKGDRSVYSFYRRFFGLDDRKAQRRQNKIRDHVNYRPLKI